MESFTAAIEGKVAYAMPSISGKRLYVKFTVDWSNQEDWLTPGGLRALAQWLAGAADVMDAARDRTVPVAPAVEPHGHNHWHTGYQAGCPACQRDRTQAEHNHPLFMQPGCTACQRGAGDPRGHALGTGPDTCPACVRERTMQTTTGGDHE